MAHADTLPESGRQSQHPRRRTALAWAALTLPAWAILLDTAVAFVRGWEFKSRLDLVGVAAVGLWAIVITALTALPAVRAFFARNAAQLTLLAVSFVVAWLVAELALGPILQRVSVPIHGQRPGWTVSYRPGPGIMRGIGPEARMTFNAWGVRGADPPPRDCAYRIMCLGGSTTGCTYLDDAKTWPALVEADLNSADPSRRVWVGNTGWPGYGTPHHREFVERSPAMAQIDCLVVQCGINDFMTCLMGPRPAPPLWTHSRIWRLAGLSLRRQMTGETTIEDSAGMVYVHRRGIRQAAQIAHDPPALAACLDEFSHNVRAMIDECRQRGVRIVFTTQPVLWRNDLDADNAALCWFGQMADGRFLSIDQLRAGIDRYNGALRAVCDERGVELVDLSPLDGDPAAFYDDCHFTEEGARQVARHIADWFVAHPPDSVHADSGQAAAP